MTEKHELDPVVLDIPVQLTVELGRTKMTIKELLALSAGAVIELDTQTVEPLNMYVNGKLFAQGEVVVVKEQFAIRITQLIGNDGMGQEWSTAAV